MTVSSFQRPTQDLAHLAWCLLVAVKFARQEGKARSPLQLHLFIMQWLSTAQKRKLFPRNLAPDILWLQEQGKRNGASARLYSKVEYIWLASSGELAEQSTLFRFTYMIDTLRTMGWQDYLLSEKDWHDGWKVADNVSAIYTPKEELSVSFTPEGALVRPLFLRFTGDISGVPPLLSQCNLMAEQRPSEQGYSVLELLPEPA